MTATLQNTTKYTAAVAVTMSTLLNSGHGAHCQAPAHLSSFPSGPLPPSLLAGVRNGFKKHLESKLLHAVLQRGLNEGVGGF